MASLSPSSTSLSSSGSMSPTPSSSSSSSSLSRSTGALPTTDIRITYESEEGNVLNRPEMIGIGNLVGEGDLIRSTNLNSPVASSPCSLSSPSSSDFVSSNTSLNSPGSRSASPKNNLTIHGLTKHFDPTRLTISHATSMDEGIAGIFPSPLSSPVRSTPSSPIGPKFKIIHEGDIHLCRLNHQRTVISKILSLKFLRRWETHRLYLTSVNIASKTTIGFMEVPIPYCQIEDAYIVSRWDSSQKFYIRIVISDGSVLLQLPNKWVRDQWLHSINWKRFMLKYQRILVNSSIRSDVLVKELKSLIELTLTTPLQDECIYQTTLDIVNDLLQVRSKDFDRKDYTIEMQMNSKKLNEEIIKILSPLLERTNPTPEICNFLSKYCRTYPRSIVICEHYSEIVQRILKHNMDFGKYPRTRVLVQDYFMALNQQNDGNNLVRTFIQCVHGFGSTCPHPRVISNIVSVCLASIFSLFEHRNLDSVIDDHDSKEPLCDEEWNQNMQCFINIFHILSQFDDWRPLLAQILQPLPFPSSTLSDSRFTIPFKSVIKNINDDPRCDVHQMLLGIREGKTSWIELYSPGNVACDDDGQLWTMILKNLIDCCCRRKRFYQSLIASKTTIDACILGALRGDETCQLILCDMLEMELAINDDMQQQMVTSLQSTESGRNSYEDLCQRQLHLAELKGGPRKLSLPSRSTDADLIKLLSCGSFGNLETLSLAFTHITSASAAYLIKLPSLRSLNLWSTQFSDSGLQLLCEHLPELQVLNLCETPVTDKGIRYLASMENLRKLNLNSTNLSSQTYEKLKQKLPSLQEIDVRYTDAW